MSITLPKRHRETVPTVDPTPIAATLRPKSAPRPGVSAEVLRDLTAEDCPAEQLATIQRDITRKVGRLADAPLPDTDWLAVLGALHVGVAARFDALNVRIAAEQIGLERSYAVAVCMLTQPFLDDVNGLLNEQLPAWRTLNAKAGCES